MFDIEEELKKLPSKPGVYIMHDKNDKIIYVGKAVSLKNRVTSYFRKTNKTKRIENMVKLIDHFEYIVVDNEQEALILECNLIKKNMPKFNVLLKDDKTYPYIKINVKDIYPDVYITRRVINDGAKYFGPYASATSAKETVEFIKNKFKIRRCKKFRYKDRACLDYYIKKCSGPCMNYISAEEYQDGIKQIVFILDGNINPVIKELREKMKGRDNFFLKDMADESDEEIVSDFIKQYYNGRNFFPNKIMIRNDFEDRESIEVWLTNMAGRKVVIKVPQKGEKAKLVEMAENNARITLDNKEKANKNLILELKQCLSLDTLPRKIEAYDISNISGQYMVSAMCVMMDGVIKKNLSRKFRIKTVYGQDDPKSMMETVVRRLRHSINLSNRNDLSEEVKNKYSMDKGFGRLPDLILADGGITQIRAIKLAIESVEREIGQKLDIAVFGMVKNDKHQTRALIDEDRNEFEVSEQLFNLITAFQDTVHDTAIGYHKFLRDQSMKKSSLDDIDGIGEIKKVALLKKFGSVSKIKEASIEELMDVNGIYEDLAYRLKEEL